jgi:hypothetical protein
MAVTRLSRVVLLLAAVCVASAFLGPGHAVPCRHAASTSTARAARVAAQMDSPFGEDVPFPPPEQQQRQQWDDSSFEGFDGVPAVDTELSTPIEPPRERKPIEATNVGVVSGPYKRRRGYHTEVTVQHPNGPDSVHRLWFGHEVLQDVARLRGCVEQDLDVERFSEQVVIYLKEQDVDLADPEGGMDDDSVPFSTQHLPVRTLFAYYEDLMQYLADELLADYVPPPTPEDDTDDIGRDIKSEKYPEDEGPLPCLGALGWGESFIHLQ